MKTKYRILISASLLLLFFVLGYYTRKVTTRPIETGTKVDTVTVWRTAAASEPEPVEVRPAAPAPVRKESLRPAPQDSAAVLVPAETRTYRDTLSDGTSYEAIITGVQPVLSSIRFKYPSSLITKTVTVSKPYEGWMLSATSNNAVTKESSWGLTSQTCLELSYNTGPFHLGLQGGVQITKSFTPAGPGFAPYLGGRLTIDIARLR